MKNNTQIPHLQEGVMKKGTLFTGMLVMALVFGMSAVGCASLFGGSAPNTFVRGQASSTTILLRLRPSLQRSSVYFVTK